MIVEYNKTKTLEASSKVPSYGSGDRFPDSMESVQTYPRAAGMENKDEARPRYQEPSVQQPIESDIVEYPRHDNGKTIDPYDPTVPMTREGDSLDKRSR